LLLSETRCPIGRREALPQSSPFFQGLEQSGDKITRKIELHSGNAETESCDKGIWYSEEPDRDLWSSFRASIARQALGPGETPMRSLCTRKPSHRRRLCQWGCFSELDIDLLVTKELHHFPPMKAALPVSPEYRMRSWWRRRSLRCRWGPTRDRCRCRDRPIDSTHSPRFNGNRRLLTLLTEQTRATMADPCRVEHPQRAIGFFSTLLRIEGPSSRTE
jgi:hypothetical protein